MPVTPPEMRRPIPRAWSRRVTVPTKPSTATRPKTESAVNSGADMPEDYRKSSTRAQDPRSRGRLSISLVASASNNSGTTQKLLITTFGDSSLS